MKFLLVLMICLGSLVWAQEASVNDDDPTMRIGEQQGTYAQVIAPAIKCDACKEAATNNQLNVADLNYGVGSAKGSSGASQDGKANDSQGP